eukprot:3174827-Amphidinium_carterae.1
MDHVSVLFDVPYTSLQYKARNGSGCITNACCKHVMENVVSAVLAVVWMVGLSGMTNVTPEPLL